MTSKALRIMIAAEQYAQRLSIERHLNHLGHYRIAPVNSIEEIILLADYPIDYFDLLIITKSMYVAGRIDLIDGGHDDLRIRNILIIPAGVAPVVSYAS